MATLGMTPRKVTVQAPVKNAAAQEAAAPPPAQKKGKSFNDVPMTLEDFEKGFK